MKKFSASKKHEDFFCLDSLMAHLKGNAVTFPTVYCWSNNSKRLRNGEVLPLSEQQTTSFFLRAVCWGV